MAVVGVVNNWSEGLNSGCSGGSEQVWGGGSWGGGDADSEHAEVCGFAGGGG